MSRTKYWGRAYLVLLLALSYLPIVLVVAYSFNSSRYGVWSGFTFDWYVKLLGNRSLQNNLITSLKVGLMSAAAAALIGTSGAVGLAGSRFKAKGLLEGLVLAPLMLPEIILGMAYLTLFSALEITFGLGTLIVAHTTFCVPYIFLNVQSRLAGMDPHLVEAARDLGASPSRAFLDVTLPLIAPAVFSGSLLAFVMSMDDVVISFFVKGVGSDTLPLRIYSMTKTGITPEIYALCSMMLAVAIVALLFYALFRKLTAHRR